MEKIPPIAAIETQKWKKNNNMTTITVTIQTVPYPPATTEATDSTWYILTTSQGTAKGRMAWRPKPGEDLILEGKWAVYKGNREFAFSSARIDVPTDPRDMLHYVASRTLGLGPSAEAQIWTALGADWQNIKPGDVPRVTGRVLEEFQLQMESLISKSEEAKVVATLMGKSCTMNLACKAWAAWQSETLGVVQADVYRLAELEGYSFRDIDGDIRRGYGISDNDPRRVRAAVLYALRRLTAAGDTLVVWGDLYREACGLLAGYDDMVSDATRELFDEGALKGFSECEGVALASDWKAESDIWGWMNIEKQVANMQKK